MNYCERLKLLREDRVSKTNQKEIAELLNTTQQYYSEYERGIRPLPIEHLITLCNFYKVSADYILGISYDYDRPRR